MKKQIAGGRASFKSLSRDLPYGLIISAAATLTVFGVLNCSLGRLGVLATAGQRRGVIMSENETGGAAEAKPRLGSPSIRPQPSVPEITTLDRLRQILATPIYIIALVFDLLSELFTGIAERIDGSSSGYHS